MHILIGYGNYPGTTGNWLVDHEDPAGYTTPFPEELQALLAKMLERRGHLATLTSNGADAVDRLFTSR